MELTLLTNEGSIGKEISSSLHSGKYSDFKIAVAYAKNSGISRIYNDLSNFANNGGKTSVVVGIDQNNTSYQALINLRTFTQDELFIHHDKNFDITFHPKMYLFGNKDIEKVIIGSSNLTGGGLYLNYEANVGIILSTSSKARKFRKQVCDYWESLLRDENTKKCDISLLNKLFEYGSLVDERKQKSFKEIIEKIYDLPFSSKKRKRILPHIATQTALPVPLLKDKFAMTLSVFDVSTKSQDPVILIPKTALKMMPLFWNFPMLYTESGAGYPQLYAIANINIDGKILKDQHIRIYYYDSKSEFRFQCEPVKRNGEQGDIIIIQKRSYNMLEYEIELIRRDSHKYKATFPLLINKVSAQKYFTYY